MDKRKVVKASHNTPTRLPIVKSGDLLNPDHPINDFTISGKKDGTIILERVDGRTLRLVRSLGSNKDSGWERIGDAGGAVGDSFWKYDSDGYVTLIQPNDIPRIRDMTVLGKLSTSDSNCYIDFRGDGIAINLNPACKFDIRGTLTVKGSDVSAVLQGLDTAIKDINTNIAANTASIGTINTKLTQHGERIKALEDRPSGGGDEFTYDVFASLYDTNGSSVTLNKNEVNGKIQLHATGVKGDKGDTGETGPQGPAGADGAKGDTGDTGPQGPAGEAGPAGTDGTNGTDGADGLPPEHEWNGTYLRFKNPDGTWGTSSNLKGEKGDSGEGGGTVVPDKDPNDYSVLVNAPTDSTRLASTDWMESKPDGFVDWRAMGKGYITGFVVNKTKLTYPATMKTNQKGSVRFRVSASCNFDKHYTGISQNSCGSSLELWYDLNGTMTKHSVLATGQTKTWTKEDPAPNYLETIEFEIPANIPNVVEDNQEVTIALKIVPHIGDNVPNGGADWAGTRIYAEPNTQLISFNFKVDGGDYGFVQSTDTHKISPMGEGVAIEADEVHTQELMLKGVPLTTSLAVIDDHASTIEGHTTNLSTVSASIDSCVTRLDGIDTSIEELSNKVEVLESSGGSGGGGGSMPNIIIGGDYLKYCKGFTYSAPTSYVNTAMSLSRAEVRDVTVQTDSGVVLQEEHTVDFALVFERLEYGSWGQDAQGMFKMEWQDDYKSDFNVNVSEVFRFDPEGDFTSSDGWFADKEDMGVLLKKRIANVGWEAWIKVGKSDYVPSSRFATIIVTVKLYKVKS